MEAELQTTLVVRHSRGITPTAAGSLFYKHVARILDDIDIAVQEVRTLNASVQRHLRVGISPSTFLLLGAEAFVEASDTISEITVSFLQERSGALLNALMNGQVDVAFLNNTGDVEASFEEEDAFERTAILEEDLLFVTAAHEANGQDTISFAEVLEHDLVLGGERSTLRPLIEAEARRHSMSLRVAYEFHSLIATKEMIMRGGVASILPYSVLSRDIADGILAGRRIQSPAIVRTLYLVRPKQHTPLLDHPQVIAYLDTLVGSNLKAMGSWARRLS